jgi:hypothetical protein
MRTLRYFLPLIFFISVIGCIALTSKSSDALPAFARKHEAACSICHSSWPRLNDFGFKYLLNGYQMPETEDGGEAGKIKVAEDLPLDSPSSFPPFTLRLEGIAYLKRTSHTTAGENGQASGPLSSGEMAGNILGGGTLTKNVSYYLDIYSSSESAKGSKLEGMFLGFHNIFGRGMVNIKFGSLLNPDLDAVHGTRRVFYSKSPVPLPMSWSAGNGTGRADSYDLGISIYGRPNYGPITYDFIVSQGNGGETDNDNDDNIAYTGMVRGDFGPIAASARYFVNPQGFGGTAGSRKYRNEVNEWTAGIRYSSHRFDIDFLYDTAAQSDVSSTGVGTRRESSGFMLEGLLRISSSFEVGAVYETLSEKEGGADSNKDAGFSLEGAWYITQNARMTIKTLWDMQNDKYKSKYTAAGGEQKGIDGSKITIGFDVAL